MQNVRPALRHANLTPAPTALSQAVRSSLNPAPANGRGLQGCGSKGQGFQGPGHQEGFGMLETLLVATASLFLVGGAYMMYDKGYKSRQVSQERENVGAIAENVMRIYSGRSSFSSLTSTTAIDQGVYPPNMIPAKDRFNAGIKSLWNDQVTVVGATVDAPAGITNNAFTITYSNVPSSVCADFVTSTGNGFYEVTVNSGFTATRGIHDGSVLNTTNKSRIDPALASQRCAAESLVNVAFTYLAGGTTSRTSCVGSGPIPPNSGSQTANCPLNGTVQQIVSDPGPDQYQPSWPQTRSQDAASCGSDGVVVWGPWSPWSPTHTCVDPCSPVSSVTHNTRTASCPAGQLVSTPGAYLYQSSWPQNQDVTQTQTCTTPIGPLGPASFNISLYTPVLTCAPVCAPVSGTDTQPAPCPPGQLASTSPYGSTSGTMSRTTSQTCNTPIGPLGAVVYGPWGAPVGQSCSPECTPTSTTETQPAPCPAGQISTTSPYGSTSGTHSRTVTQTCSTPVGPLGPPAPGPWGAPVGQSCAPPCTPTSTPQSQSVACPAGTTGSWTQTRTITMTCATPTTPGAPVTSPWSPATEPAGTCTPVCGPSPAPVNQSLTCPPGQSGTWTQTHGWTSSPAPTCWTAGPWTDVTNTCTPNPPASCTNPAPSTTPACPSGGNQTGGSWSQAPYPGCSWTYSGGVCPVSYNWTLTYWQDYGMSAGGGQQYYTCAWSQPNEGDIGNNFNPGVCTAAHVGDQYYCSILVPLSHDNMRDEIWTCMEQ